MKKIEAIIQPFKLDEVKEALKAIDVFYVTAAGRKLDVDKQTAMAEALQRVAVSL